MKLHKNKELFLDAIAAAAQRYNIPEVYIEKDYWVTAALHAIFHSEIGTQAVFKGGTSLSKCYKIVERFSEDVDIVVLHNEGESANRLKAKLKAITEVVHAIMPEIEIPGITNKVGQIRKTAHVYSRENVTGAFGQVREHIILEATWLGSSEPYTMAEVSCYIVDMMLHTGQTVMIKEYNLTPFTIKVLSKERTFCEKIMSLVRFSQTETPYADLSNKIRHIYDIHMMLKDGDVARFFDCGKFDELLAIVGNDDLVSFKNNNAWLKNHPKDAIVFKNPTDTWEKIKTPYSTTFKDLVVGALPEADELISTLKRVAAQLQKVKWDLHW